MAECSKDKSVENQYSRHFDAKLRSAQPFLAKFKGKINWSLNPSGLINHFLFYQLKDPPVANTKCLYSTFWPLFWVPSVKKTIFGLLDLILNFSIFSDFFRIFMIFALFRLILRQFWPNYLPKIKMSIKWTWDTVLSILPCPRPMVKVFLQKKKFQKY